MYVEENGSLVLSSSQDKLQCVFVVVRGDDTRHCCVFEQQCSFVTKRYKNCVIKKKCVIGTLRTL